MVKELNELCCAMHVESVRFVSVCAANATATETLSCPTPACGVTAPTWGVTRWDQVTDGSRCPLMFTQRTSCQCLPFLLTAEKNVIQSRFGFQAKWVVLDRTQDRLFIFLRVDCGQMLQELFVNPQPHFCYQSQVCVCYVLSSCFYLH